MKIRCYEITDMSKVRCLDFSWSVYVLSHAVIDVRKEDRRMWEADHADKLVGCNYLGSESLPSNSADIIRERHYYAPSGAYKKVGNCFDYERLYIQQEQSKK